MKLFGELLFNLELNAIASFWLGLGAALLLVRAARLGEREGALLLLALPLGKVVFDLGRGVPESSFFWGSRLGERQELGSFRIGFGLRSPLAAPTFDGELWALHRGERSPQSIADLLARALSKRVWEAAVPVIGWAVVLVSLAFLAARIVELGRSRARAARIRAEGTCVEKRALGRRRVDVIEGDGYQGVPFAAGLARPFVVLPRHTCQALRLDEREAVLRHELAHVAHFDVAWIVAAAVLGDALWYVPGALWLARRMRAMVELAADRAAVDAGVRPDALASAIVSVGELAIRSGHGAPADPVPALHAPFVKSGLRRRVERLLDGAAFAAAREGSGARWRRPGLWLRIALVVWIGAGVLQSVCCGNHAG
jgi:Zn-dependent protease with chaperone function